MVAQADDALFRPVRTGNPFEETVERLLQAIKLGVVVPGDRLPSERDLAVRLNVSRVTLREAIHALTEAGYVESRRGRYGGTFVNEQLPKPRRTPVKRLARDLAAGLDDALTLRFVLETGAAEAAASRPLTAAERDHLERCLADTSAASLADYRRLDSRLHLAIAEVTGSPSLISATADALATGVPMPYWLLTQNQTMGSLKTLAKLRDSWKAPILTAPSPNMQNTMSFALR